VGMYNFLRVYVEEKTNSKKMSYYTSFQG